MAFEDAYGEVNSTSHVKGFYDSVNEDYLPVLLALLPPGPIWEYEDGDEMWELLTALSYALTRVEARGCDLLEEIDPRTTVELIDDWERVLDLPGDNPSPPTTLAGRRGAVHGRLLGYGDPTPPFYVGVAAGVGYTVTVAHKEFDPFVPGSVSGDPLTQHEWAFAWHVIATGAADDATLRWTLGRLVPAHTVLIFKIAAATWDSRTSGFGATGIHGMGYGNELYVAVGAAGTLTTSPDGVTWTARTSQFGADTIYVIMSAAAILLAAGANGKLSTSTDGTTWTARTSQFGADAINAVIYRDNLFLAAGTTGKLSTSTTGATWTAQAAAGAYAGIFMCAAFGRELYILGGTAGEIQTSPDGAAWTSRVSQFGADTVRSIAYGNGTLVAVGDAGKLSSSVDGTTWTAQTSQFGSTIIRKVIWDGGQFVAVGHSGKVSTSPDGVTWTAQTSQFGSTNINTVIYGNGLLVAIGSSGKLAVSTDGGTWTLRESGFGSEIISGIAYGAYLFAVGGADGKLSTTPYGEL